MGKIIVVIIIFLMVFTTIAGFMISNDDTPVEKPTTKTIELIPMETNRTKSSNCSFDYLPLPDPDCTTGDVFENLTKDDICWSGYSKSVRDVSESLKNKVYESYGIYDREPYEYEIDHLVNLAIGGSNEVSNLFPQKYNMTLGAYTKDKVENCFHRKVCDGSLDLKLAQSIMANNWTQGLEICGIAKV